MDAIKLLREDHRTVERLFKEFERLDEGATEARQRVVDELVRVLKLHGHVEETIFYPALLPLAQEDERRFECVILEGIEVQALVTHLIGELAAIDAGHQRFDARVKVLKDLVTHHVEEQEKEMLPRARNLLGHAQLEALGEQISAAGKRGAPGEALRVTPLVREFPVEAHTDHL